MQQLNSGKRLSTDIYQSHAQMTKDSSHAILSSMSPEKNVIFQLNANTIQNKRKHLRSANPTNRPGPTNKRPRSSVNFINRAASAVFN